MAAIGLGYAMLLFVACLMAGLRQQMIESGTGLVLSDIEVHAPDYYPDRPTSPDLGRAKRDRCQRAALPPSPPTPGFMLRVPGCTATAWSARPINRPGCKSSASSPIRNRQITVLQTRMVKGSYLTERMPKGVVMGDKLATTIGVEVGSEIVLLTPAADGSTGNDLYTVAGMFHTGLDTMDRGLVLMSLASLQELLRLPPGRIHEVGIKLHDITAATTAAAALEVQLSKTLPVRVRAWPELAPELADYVQFNRRVTFILFFIFFLLAVMGIVNTMLMAIIERTRELGMLMAVGMRPSSGGWSHRGGGGKFGGSQSGFGRSAWGSAPLVFAGSWFEPGWRSRRGLSGWSRGGPPLVRSAGFHGLHSGRSGAGRHGSGVGPLSRVAGGSLSADGGAPKGLAMMGVLLLVKIGWRNLWRNPRGTLLTALALGLGLTLLLISLGLLDGSHEQMVGNGVRFGTGHVVIQAQGYQDTGSQELLLPARVVSTTEEFLHTEAMKHVAARRESPAAGLWTAEFRSQRCWREHDGGHPQRGAGRIPDSPADRRGDLSQ